MLLAASGGPMTLRHFAEPNDLVACRDCGESISLAVDRAIPLAEQDSAIALIGEV